MAAPPTTVNTPHFSIVLLGAFGVLRDGDPLDTAAWPRRAQTLLKLLAIAPANRRLREEVIDLLWPDAGPEAGGNNLRYVLHALRRDLGGGDPPPITLDREWIGLSDHYVWEIDLRSLEAMAAQASVGVEALGEAVALFSGEALPEDRYEDWSTSARDRADRLWRSLALRLVRTLREDGDHGSATGWVDRLLDRDPLDEEAIQELLRTLEAGGQRVEAARRFTEFERRLKEELGVEPARETFELAHRATASPGEGISAGVFRPGPSTAPPIPTGRFLGALPIGPIVERKDELERLDAAAATVLSGSGRFIVLSGEPGAGKTRLEQEATVSLRDQGFLVLTARCSARAQDVEFHPIVEAVSQIGDRFSSPDAHPATVDAEQLLTQLTDGAAGLEALHVARRLHFLLTVLARKQPVALLLDDLHFADTATITVLQQLAASTRGERVLLLAAYRDPLPDSDHPVAQMMRDLDREGLVERLAVRRLTEEGTAALVEAAIGDLDPAADFVEFVHRRTKGNPFYIDKMLCALGGRYRLVRQIGAGGMGRVFEAVDTRTAQTVAAKIMFARTEADPKALQRFEQEGNVLAALDHPNVVRVEGVFLEERANCIVMELLPGRSLGRVLTEERPGLERVRHIALQVARALAAAHERGIVHRDIKPDNIMVLEDDRIKVTDFGIARLMRPARAALTMTSTGMAMGTPFYMAPEQIEGRAIDGRADIYALGCVLYQMVTGVPPFEADDPLTVAIKHLREEPRPPREHNPRLPREWEQLILKALAKDPTNRYPTASSMEAALATLGEGSVDTASRIPLGAARSRWGLAAALPIVLAIAVLVYRGGVTPNTNVLGRQVAAWSQPPASVPFKKPAAVAVTPGGTFYVLDEGRSRVVRLSRSGHVLGAWGGLGSARGELRQPEALTVDGQGNVYVADTGNDRVEKFSPAGRLEAVWGHTGQLIGQFRSPDGIAVDRHGNVYVADSGNSRIEVLSPSGRPEATGVGSFNALYGNLNGPAAVVVTRAGSVFVADTGDNAIDHFAPGIITAVRVWSGSGDPTGLAVGPHGDVYVTDSNRSNVQLYSASGKLLRTWRTGAGRSFDHPQGLYVDGGSVYLADTGNGRILKLSGSGRWVPAWRSGSAEPAGAPDAMTITGTGNIVMADSSNNRLITLSPSGRWLGARTLAPSGFVGPIGGLAGDGHTALLVTDYEGNRAVRLTPDGRILAKWGSNPAGPGLINPQGIAVDKRGDIYVVDQGNDRILRYSPTGRLRAVWPVPGTTGATPYLYDIASGPGGSIFVTDSANDQVIKFSAGGGIVARWGGEGSKPGRLRAPEGIVVDDRRGRVYVADTDNRRIEAFSLSGQYLGETTNRFTRPVAVAISHEGAVFVADAGANRVVKFVPVGH